MIVPMTTKSGLKQPGIPLDFFSQSALIALDFHYSEVWIPTPAHDKLVLFHSSVKQEPPNPRTLQQHQNLTIFEHLSQSYSFERGVGIPGKVWQTGLIEWESDATSVPDQLFLRRSLAQNLGLAHILAVPITHMHAVIGVQVFFSANPSLELSLYPHNQARLFDVAKKWAIGLGDTLMACTLINRSLTDPFLVGSRSNDDGDEGGSQICDNSKSSFRCEDFETSSQIIESNSVSVTNSQTSQAASFPSFPILPSSQVIGSEDAQHAFAFDWMCEQNSTAFEPTSIAWLEEIVGDFLEPNFELPGDQMVVTAPVACATKKTRTRKRVQHSCDGCGATETPKWRLLNKTDNGCTRLCNACGLRAHYQLNKKVRQHDIDAVDKDESFINQTILSELEMMPDLHVAPFVEIGQLSEASSA